MGGHCWRLAGHHWGGGGEEEGGGGERLLVEAGGCDMMMIGVDFAGTDARKMTSCSGIAKTEKVSHGLGDCSPCSVETEREPFCKIQNLPLRNRVVEAATTKYVQTPAGSWMDAGMATSSSSNPAGSEGKGRKI